MAVLREPRWTHIALPVSNLDRSVAFYEEMTPLVTVRRNEDDTMRGAWLSNKGQVETPFVLVLGEFLGAAGARFDINPGRRIPILAPFAHLGIELPTREDVDRIALKAGRAGASLRWQPTYMGEDIGYTCAVTDPDGNTIEFASGQKVFSTVQEIWG